MIKLNKYDSFDGDVLFTSMELDVWGGILCIDVAVSLDENENIEIYPASSKDGEHELTEYATEDQIANLREYYSKAAEQEWIDAAAAYGDYLYEQIKDKQLEELWEEESNEA